MLTDDFGEELHREIKLCFYSYYDTIKNNVDITTQIALMNQNCPDVQREILTQNTLIIDTVNEIMISNLKEIDKYFGINFNKLNEISFYSNCNYNEENLKKLIISNFCFYIPPDGMKVSLKQENRLGCLITSDWYMTSNEKGFILKEFIDSHSNSTADLEINEVIL